MTGVFDAHIDILLELRHRRAEARPFESHWLGQLQKGGVKIQTCPIYTVGEPPGQRVRSAVEQMAAFHRAVADNGEAVRWIRTREDLDELLGGDDRIGLIPSMEGVEPFEEDLEMVDALYELGVRMAGLTWNASNKFASGGGDDDDRGLSSAGRDLVKRMQDRGYVIDLSHTSTKTFWDLLEMSDERPPVFTHTCCRSVYESTRNADDEQLRALAEVGGVAGMMMIPLTVDIENPTMDRVVDHIDHAASVMGDDKVGIGGDFVGQIFHSGAIGDDPVAGLPANQRAAGMAADASVEGLEGPQDYRNLVAALEGRGWSGSRLEGVALGNFSRVLREALPTRAEH